ncbi:hypothetical protein R80B4_00035 [Fibrobacteres bacterium R8-0-B4]
MNRKIGAKKIAKKITKKSVKKSVKAKRKHKDTLFRDLFGTEGAALELYNAVNGTNYGPETDVTMVTLKDVLYDAPVNDVSFTIDNKLVVLVEHQSTINENMPLRMLLYVARSYEQLTDDADKYRRDRMTIPRPEFIVLYNGEEDRPEIEILKLSELFAKCGMEYTVNLELIVRVYNINKGRNPEIARRSATLDGYEIFTAKIREYRKTLGFGQAVDRATEECIKDGVLVDYLQTHRKAVRNMLTTEWKLEDAIKIREEEAEKRAERKFIKHMYQEGFSVADILKATGLPEKDIKKILGL